MHGAFIIICTNNDICNSSLVLTAAPDIYPGGPGVGFVDNPDGGGSVRGLEVSGQSIILRQNEWLKYDLSALTPGVYRMSILRSCTGTPSLTVSLNDQVIFSKRTVRPSGSYNTMLEFTFGEVEITDENSVLKIENTASSAMYLKEIKFVDMVMMAKKEAILKVPRPYKMSYLPCIIQAENYDVGVSGVAFKDSEDVNSGAKYRENEPVDI